MAHSFPLPSALEAAGWRLKIRDREIREPPHVTVIRGSESWRYDLRKRQFMDRKPPPRDVATGVVEHIEQNIAVIVSAWDAMYPANPVALKDKE